MAKRQLGQDAQRAERAVHHLEQQLVLFPRTAGQHVAAACHDLVLQAGVVEAAVAVRHRLDRTTGDRAAHGDGLQLGSAEGNQPLRQRGVDQVDERDAGLGHAGARRDVDVQDLGQSAHVDLAVSRTAQAGLRHLMRDGLLAQMNRAMWGPRPSLLADALHLRVVRHRWLNLWPPPRGASAPRAAACTARPRTGVGPDRSTSTSADSAIWLASLNAPPQATYSFFVAAT